MTNIEHCLISIDKIKGNNNSQYKVPWMQSHTPDTQTIHLSAANGFSVGSYTSFIEGFNNQFSFTAMDCRGTWGGVEDPPKNFNLDDFTDDLINGIEKQHSSPVIGMGHSIGGLITLLAAIKKPDLFTKIILIEPASLPNKWIDHCYPYIPQKVLFTLLPFMAGSLNRQRFWQTKEQFHQKYRNHKTYSKFTEEAFNDYVQYGLIQHKNHWQLAFSPEWEAHIFKKLVFLWTHLKKVSIPTLFIKAEHSNLYSSQQFNKYNQDLPRHVTATELKGSHHLVPFEKPDLTIAIIANWLAKQDVHL